MALFFQGCYLGQAAGHAGFQHGLGVEGDVRAGGGVVGRRWR